MNDTAVEKAATDPVGNDRTGLSIFFCLLSLMVGLPFAFLLGQWTAPSCLPRNVISWVTVENGERISHSRQPAIDFQDGILHTRGPNGGLR